MEKAPAQRSRAKANGHQKPHLNANRAVKGHNAVNDLPSRSSDLAHNGSIDHLLHLQRTLGNGAVGRLLQAKLTVSHPDDPYEREADRVADTVMRMPEPAPPDEEETSVQAKPLAPNINRLVQRKSQQPLEEEEEKVVATKSLVQRVPVAVREDDEEEKVAPKLEPGAALQEEEKEKPVQAKLETDTAIRRQAKQDEEGEEEPLQSTAPIQRQMEDEDEGMVQTKSLSGVLLRIPRVSPVTASSSIGAVQRLCTECEGEKQREEGKPAEMVQRKSARYQLHDDHDEEEQQVQPKGVDAATPLVTTSVAANIRSLNHGGSPLPQATRGFFEPRFGADFSQVRVHTDARSAGTAKSINAKAFTVGRNIAFGAGQYAPHSGEGRQLLAHELTHVVQQEAGPVSGAPIAEGMSISDPSDAYERAGSQTAKTFMQQLHDDDTTLQLNADSPRHDYNNGAFIQREDAAPAPLTPEALIASHTNFIGDLDEKKLGEDLAKRLPGESPFVYQVFNKLPDSDQDDVAYEIILVATLGNIPDWLRMKFVEFMVTGIVTDEEEEAIANIWRSFKPGLPEAAEKNRDLWKKSLWESDDLVEEVKPIRESFGVDVKGLARAYLAENKQTLLNEANLYGIDLEGGKSVAPTQPGYMEAVRSMVPGVVKLRGYLEELKEINVGYHQISDCLAGDCKAPSKFTPQYKPAMDPEGTESPPWPKWEEVKVRYDRTSALISAFGGKYPSIYLLIQQDKLDALAQAGDAAKAQEVIQATLEKTGEKIKEADAKIVGGEVTYYDLKMIQSQLFSGPPKVAYEPAYHWEQPFYQDIANDDIKGHDALEFWVNMGLSLLAAIALIAAPFTGGLTAAFLIGFGVGIGAAQAGLSWEKYLSMSTVADANVKEELTLISQSEVTAQLVEAIVQTVAVFLDIWGAKAATTTAKQSAKALEATEKGLKEELTAAARKKALRETTAEDARAGARAAEAVAEGVGPKVKESIDFLHHAICGLCFAAGTLVVTRSGRRPIETLRAGDFVLARHDAYPDRVGYRRVLETYCNATDRFIEVGAAGQVIRSTPGHVWWCVDKGWIFAQELELGDRVVTDGDAPVPVTSLRVVDEVALGYNLAVEDFATYYVAADAHAPALWVHNTSAVRILRPDQVFQLILPNIVITNPSQIRTVVGAALTPIGSYTTEVGGVLQYVRGGGAAGFQGFTKEAAESFEVFLTNLGKKGGGGVVAAVDLARVGNVPVYDLANPENLKKMVNAYPRFEAMFNRVASEGVIAVGGKVPARAVQGMVRIPPGITDVERRALLTELMRACMR